jgi:SAM-dependent methyltransferase
MYLYLKEKTDFFTKKQKVLHIAPEYCFLDRFEKQSNLDYITADIESPLAKIKMDVHAIPFDNNTFDVVICNHVMEHVDDFVLAMSEINRVLNKTGWAIIQSPQDYNRANTYEDPSIVDPKEREIHFLQNDHLRLFGRDYNTELEKGGFRVTEDFFVRQMDAKLVEKYGLPKEEIVYFCQKG